MALLPFAQLARQIAPTMTAGALKIGALVPDKCTAILKLKNTNGPATAQCNFYGSLHGLTL